MNCIQTANKWKSISSLRHKKYGLGLTSQQALILSPMVDTQRELVMKSTTFHMSLMYSFSPTSHSCLISLHIRPKGHTVGKGAVHRDGKTYQCTNNVDVKKNLCQVKSFLNFTLLVEKASSVALFGGIFQLIVEFYVTCGHVLYYFGFLGLYAVCQIFTFFHNLHTFSGKIILALNLLVYKLCIFPCLAVQGKTVQWSLVK